MIDGVKVPGGNLSKLTALRQRTQNHNVVVVVVEVENMPSGQSKRSREALISEGKLQLVDGNGVCILLYQLGVVSEIT